MEFTLSRREQERKVQYISKKSIFTSVNSHVNGSKSNNLNTSNSDNVIGTSNLTYVNIQNDSPFNTFNNLKKVTDTDYSVIINDEIIDKNI